MKLLAVDPSINSLGWAIFDDEKLVRSGVLLSSADDKRNPSLEDRMSTMIRRLDAVCQEEFLDTVIIEQPQSWGAYKSVASTHSGSLLILHIFVGALWAWGFTLGIGDRGAKLIKVHTWKGQIPKTLTYKRVVELYGGSPQKYDESDAIGLGTWYIQHGKE